MALPTHSVRAGDILVCAIGKTCLKLSHKCLTFSTVALRGLRPRQLFSLPNGGIVPALSLLKQDLG